MVCARHLDAAQSKADGHGRCVAFETFTDPGSVAARNYGHQRIHCPAQDGIEKGPGSRENESDTEPNRCRLMLHIDTQRWRLIVWAQQLMAQINVIREKAAEAEAIVKAITGDIQRLDTAKRNLTGAIQTLERWRMLREHCLRSGIRDARLICGCDEEHAHQQLLDLLPMKNYKEMASALSVCIGLPSVGVPC